MLHDKSPRRARLSRQIGATSIHVDMAWRMEADVQMAVLSQRVEALERTVHEIKATVDRIQWAAFAVAAAVIAKSLGVDIAIF